MKAQRFMVELKARVDDLAEIRRKLTQCGASEADVFRQVDTYFKVPRGLLKLREVDESRAELIYYERENATRPRKSLAFILPIFRPLALRELLEKTLTKRTTVKKVREMYMHKGTQIHLDIVEGLGSFVEFERATTRDLNQQREDLSQLQKLMGKLGIPHDSLERSSYSDLV
jgi:predicted adenylyl cyclase CyaB